MIIKRNRTPSVDILYALYLYFLGLSTRSVSEALFFLHNIKRSHVANLEMDSNASPQKDMLKNKEN
jgi:putative transposase